MSKGPRLRPNRRYPLYEQDFMEVGKRAADMFCRDNAVGKRGYTPNRKRRFLSLLARLEEANPSLERAKRFSRLTEKQRKRRIRFIRIRDGGKLCWYCEKPFGPTRLRTVDHILPLSKGGSNKVKNLRLACYQCNKARGNSVHFTSKGVFKNGYVVWEKQATND